jgi:hypothetical protein
VDFDEEFSNDDGYLSNEEVAPKNEDLEESSDRSQEPDAESNLSDE